jgi:hypothetical protein
VLDFCWVAINFTQLEGKWLGVRGAVIRLARAPRYSQRWIELTVTRRARGKEGLPYAQAGRCFSPKLGDGQGRLGSARLRLLGVRSVAEEHK